jgi:hypothetical protein
MIKNNECVVLITSGNIKYYSKKGYSCIIGEKLSLDISEVSKMSHNLIIAICKLCNNEVNLPYSKYNINYNRGGFYSCKKCSSYKRKKTNIIKYGVDTIFKRDDLREISKKWMSSIEFREKSINTQKEKYGCLYTETEDFRDNISKSIKKIIKEKKENNTYECYLSLPENDKLKKEAMFVKYGNECSFLVPEIKEKIIKTNLERFGHISPFGNNEIQVKIKNSINRSKVDLGTLDLFKVYRRKIRYHTKLIRNKVFEEWDGYDYYDNEYIKDYLNLHRTDNKYPSIDHKISCFYGFLNNLPTTDISDISNICITKRILNCQKGYLNENQFIELNNMFL